MRSLLFHLPEYLISSSFPLPFDASVVSLPVDAINAFRLLLEKHLEKQKPVHFAILDLEKAFDSIPRED